MKRKVNVFVATKQNVNPIVTVLSMITDSSQVEVVDTYESADVVLFTDPRDIEANYQPDDGKHLGYLKMMPKQPVPNLPEEAEVLYSLWDVLGIIARAQNDQPPEESARQVAESITYSRDAPANLERILVIDDRESNRNAALRDLSDYRLTVASRYEEAMLLLSEEQFDIVLTDLKLPMSSRTLSEEAFELGKLVNYGFLLMLEAASRGVRYIAVVSDIDHHQDPMAAAFDRFQRSEWRLNGAKLRLLHAKMVNGEKDWADAFNRLLNE